jgi:peptidyl-prolyl cis-trans isomerase A (cyclophilin A)
MIINPSIIGDWVIEVHPSWSPNGAKRYLDLVKDKFYDGVPLFRALPGFLVQFGISMDPAMNNKWKETIEDDPFPFNVSLLPMQ